MASFSALHASATAVARRYAFEYWDVFTRKPLQGNPLCVFLDAKGLTDQEMHALARETNLSETTFVLPSNRVRIWTPLEEYPFAGHPTLGTAMALRTPGMKQIVLQEKIGPVPVISKSIRTVWSTAKCCNRSQCLGKNINRKTSRAF